MPPVMYKELPIVLTVETAPKFDGTGKYSEADKLPCDVLEIVAKKGKAEMVELDGVLQYITPPARI